MKNCWGPLLEVVAAAVVAVVLVLEVFGLPPSQDLPEASLVVVAVVAAAIEPVPALHLQTGPAHLEFDQPSHSAAVAADLYHASVVAAAFGVAASGVEGSELFARVTAAYLE